VTVAMIAADRICHELATAEVSCVSMVFELCRNCHHAWPGERA
jgi:hypothetical protein